MGNCGLSDRGSLSEARGHNQVKVRSREKDYLKETKAKPSPNLAES